jgi:hypothetical protein
MVLAQKHRGKPVITIEDPDINPHVYSQLIFDKGVFTPCIHGVKKASSVFCL